MSLSKEAILGIKDLQVQEVEVPEWGGSVYVRGLTGAERDAFEASVVEQRGKATKVNMVNMRAKLLVLTICDKDGMPLFTHADIDELGKKSAVALQRLFDIASSLSGLSEKDAEDLVKN